MIFNSVPIPDGYSWTITSKLGHMLQEAEAKFGPRDKTYTILGVEFTSEGRPQIWFPGNCKNIVIQITENCLDDMNQAAYQVAHETIHCLFPVGHSNANVLEEGLAVYFAGEYCLANGHGVFNPNQQQYIDALRFYLQLIAIDPDIIKKIRLVEPTISRLTSAILLQVNPAIPQALANSLTRRF
jgi:hypothetical protein